MLFFIKNQTINITYFKYVFFFNKQLILMKLKQTNSNLQAEITRFYKILVAIPTLYDTSATFITQFFKKFHLVDWIKFPIKIQSTSTKIAVIYLQTLWLKGNTSPYIQIEEINRQEDELTINYVCKNYNSISTEKLKVDVKLKQSDNSLQILIKDHSNSLVGLFQPENRIQQFNPISHNQLKNKDILIFPNQNTYTPETQKPSSEEMINYFLVFQGGGAKGSSYVGSIISFRQNMKGQIKSITATSVGTYFGLLAATPLTFNQIKELSSWTNYIPKYKSIELLSQVNQQKRQEYQEKIMKIRKFLHDYGIIFNEMFDVIRNEVFDQQLMDALFNQICGDNQTLKEAFRIKLAPRKYSDKLTNFYGLLDGYIMFATKIKNEVGYLIQTIIVKEFKEDQNKVYSILNISSQIQKVKLKQEIQYFTKISLINLKNYVEQLEANERYDIQNNEQPETKKILIEIFNEEIAEQMIIYLKSSLRKYGISLTMKQFYDLTGIQLTYCAIDLDDKILRFFNQKTTPKLPVSVGSEIGMSVPIIFKQLQWKSEWGNYHINYEKYKKVIDITGHTFTDAGFFANNPLAFCQNQTIQNVYFDHKTEKNSKLIGFGFLQQSRSKVQSKNRIQKPLSDSRNYHQTSRQLKKIQIDTTLPTQRSGSIMALDSTVISSVQTESPKKQKKSFSRLLAEKIPKLKLLYYQLFHKPEVTSIYTSELTKLIKDIPLLNILMKVVDMYKQGSDNFIKECYEDKIYTFKTPQLQHSHSQQNLQTIKSLINNIKAQVQSYQCKIYSVIETVELFLEKLNTKSHTQYKLIVSKLKVYLREKLIFLRENEFQPSQSLKFTLINIIKLIDQNQICLFKYQVNVQIVDLQNQIRILINTLKQSLWDNDAKHIGEYFKKYLIYKREKDVRLLSRVMMMLDGQNITIQLVKIIKKFMQETLIPFDFNIQLLQIKLKQISEKYINIFNQIVEEQSRLDSYVNYMVSRSISHTQPSNLHLVFQGEGKQSHHYYLQAYKAVEMNVMRRNVSINQQMLDTVSDIIFRQSNMIKYSMKQIIRSYLDSHSLKFKEGQQIIFGSGIKVIMSHNLIQKTKREIQMSESKKLKISAITCSNYHALIGFYLTTGMDVQSVRLDMDNLLDAIEMHEDIAQVYESKKWLYTSKNKLNDLFNSIWQNRFDLFTELQKEVNHSKNNGNNINLDRIKKDFEAHRHDLMENFDHLMQGLISAGLNRNETQDTHIHYAKILSLKLDERDYKKQNKQQAEILQQLLYKFLSNFEDQFKYIIEHMIDDKLHILKNKNDKNYWKGVAIGKFLSAEKVKHKIQERLQQIHLTKNITLQQFNRMCPQKIELTFTGTNLTNKKMEFINYHSYPHMPVWVAIMITLSIPGLFPQVIVKQSWLKQVQNLNQKKIIKFFEGQKPKTSSKFVSGNFLMKFPLTYLTNSKIRKIYFNSQQYTYLNFRVGKSNQTIEKSTQFQFTRKFFTLNQLVEFAMNAKYFKNMDIENIPLLGKQISYIKTLILANDNMVKDIYNEEYIRLPILLKTFEFYKGHFAVSTISQQTYYYTKESLLKRNSNFQIAVTYFKVQTFFDIRRIKFLTKQVRTKNVRSFYKILYGKRLLKGTQGLSKSNYIQVEDEIQINSDQQTLHILIYYVNPLTLQIQQSIYQLTFSQDCDYSSVFELYYNKVIKKSKLISLDNSYGEEFVVIQSVLDVSKNGLKCSQCTNDLIFQNIKLISECQQCGKHGSIKFSCSECECKYCINCTRKHILCKNSKNNIICWKRHTFNYRKLNEMTFCQICDNLIKACYEDSECPIRMCEHCFNYLK